MWDRVRSIQSIRKIHKIEKTLTFLFFQPTFELLLLLHQTKSRGPLRVCYLYVIYSAVAHLYGCVMAEL